MILKKSKVIGKVSWESEFQSFGEDIVVVYDNKYYIVDWFINKRTSTRQCHLIGPFDDIEKVVDKLKYLRFEMTKEEIRKALGLK